jgi:tellurite resistance protein
VSEEENQDIVLRYNANYFIDGPANKGLSGLPSNAEMDQAAQLNAALEAAFLIAAADEELSDEELAALSRSAAALFGTSDETSSNSYRESSEKTTIPQETINAALESFCDLLDEQGYAKRYEYIASVLQSDEQRQHAFMIAVDLAMSDGKVPEEENTVIQELAKAFGFNAEKTNKLLDQVENARKK